MAHTDSRIDYESRMAERIEQDYRLLDMACAVLYGRESGKGGVDALMGSAVADCIILPLRGREAMVGGGGAPRLQPMVAAVAARHVPEGIRLH